MTCKNKMKKINRWVMNGINKIHSSEIKNRNKINIHILKYISKIKISLINQMNQMNMNPHLQVMTRNKIHSTISVKNQINQDGQMGGKHMNQINYTQRMGE